MSQELIEISPEEIKQTAQILAEVISQSHIEFYPEEATHVVEYTVIEEETIQLDIIASYQAGILDPLGQLRDWFVGVLNSIASWIASSVSTFIDKYVLPAINAVSDFLSRTIVPAINAVTSTLSSAISGAVSAISSVISNAISTITSSVSNFISGAVSTISGALSGVASAISNVISSAVSTITSAISGIVSSLSNALTSIGKTILDSISSAIGGLSKTLSDIFSSIGKSIMDTISGISKTLFDAISSIGKSIIDTISVAVKGLSDTFGAIGKTIIDTLSGFAKTIFDAISSVGKFIIDSLTTVLSGAIKTLSDFFEAVAKSILDSLSGFAKSLLDFFGIIGKSITDLLSTVAKDLLEAFSAISKTILGGFTYVEKAMRDIQGYLIGAFKDIASMVGAGFQAISQTFMGFVNAILQLPRMLYAEFGKPIAEYIRSIFTMPIYPPTSSYAYKLYKVTPSWSIPVLPLLEPLTHPIQWLQEYVATPIVEALKWVGSLLVGFWNWLVDAFKGLAKAIWDGFLALGKAFVEMVISAFKSIKEFVDGLVEGVKDIFELFVFKPIRSLFEGVARPMSDYVTAMIERIASGKSQGEIFELMGMFTALVSTQFTFRMISQALLWLGEQTKDIDIMPTISLTIFGAGTTHTVRIPVKFGAVLLHLGSEFRAYSDELMRGFFYGMAIWYTQPIVRCINSLFRNVLPIELPPVPTIVESVRRALPHKEFDEKLKTATRFMSLYGYSDYVIDMYFKPLEKYYLEVTDRFGVVRKIPLSLVYELPSASDVATMMVRDIFASIEDFQRLYKARGMEKDVGALYYFLRFRYPPPERLWQFATRGISGLLWATLPDTEKKAISEELKALNAPMPVAPVELNFKSDVILDAFKTYMKWHDYFRGAWIKGFTSDNLIYIDTLADIPTKIDQRWMVRFGIYELLSSKNVTISSPVRDFRAKVVENTAKSGIRLDLTNFSRTLQATGLHPDWVPLTAVAEAINAITDERTMLRTGTLALFKEGFWDIKSIETMLSGAVVTSFNVSYFDVDKMEWSTGWVNIPLMFLPPERKLTELRALMDRALDILKEIQRDIATGYQEYIIDTYEEFRKKLTGVIEKINTVFATDYKEITGSELPSELKLSFVEAYYKPYVESLDIWREVFTVRRIRMWTQRWLGWLMYRIATGVVSREEMNRLIDTVVKYSKLTDTEKTFLYEVMNVMFGIAMKDYAVTPTQLASLSEYIVIPDKLIEACFEARLVPKEWREVWRWYISVRPIADDVKSLLSTYRRAMLYVTIPEEVDKAVKEYAKLIGFTDREIAIMQLRNQLEELILNSREYIPTPSMLASICEYIPDARRFFESVMRARRVPREWQEVWAKYIDIRPLVDDVKRYLSRAEQLYTSFMIPSKEFEKVLTEVSTFLGYTAKELEFLKKVTDYERYRRAWTELIGTVDRLVELSEYSPKASRYALGKVEEMINALPLPENDRKQLLEMWKEYIRNRPVKAEARTYVTQLINLYVDGLITDTDFNRELEAMKEWGFSDDEIMFYKAQASLRRARKLRIPITYPE